VAAVVGAAAPVGRYVVSVDVVQDTVTGLVWQRASSAGSVLSAARDSCRTLSLGGTSGNWRLPTKKELETIVDVRSFEPSIDSLAFPNTPSTQFWTSTAVAGSGGAQWVVDFASGASVDSDVTTLSAVRCVR